MVMNACECSWKLRWFLLGLKRQIWLPRWKYENNDQLPPPLSQNPKLCQSETDLAVVVGVWRSSTHSKRMRKTTQTNYPLSRSLANNQAQQSLIFLINHVPSNPNLYMSVDFHVTDIWYLLSHQKQFTIWINKDMPLNPSPSHEGWPIYILSTALYFFYLFLKQNYV